LRKKKQRVIFTITSVKVCAANCNYPDFQVQIDRISICNKKSHAYAHGLFAFGRSETKLSAFHYIETLQTIDATLFHSLDLNGFL
jgi:hypothetical protein